LLQVQNKTICFALLADAEKKDSHGLSCTTYTSLFPSTEGEGRDATSVQLLPKKEIRVDIIDS
jgi:hypothetical protein